MPEPSDPLFGLINSQGLPVLHLVYFLMAWFFIEYAEVNKETGTNMCMFLEGDEEDPTYVLKPADSILFTNVQ